MFLSINNFELSVFGPTANITSVKPPFGVNCFGSFFWILVITFLRSINNILELPLVLKESVLTQFWARGISCRTESWWTAQKLKNRWYWVQDQKPSTVDGLPLLVHFTLWPFIFIIWTVNFNLFVFLTIPFITLWPRKQISPFPSLAWYPISETSASLIPVYGIGTPIAPSSKQ